LYDFFPRLCFLVFRCFLLLFDFLRLPPLVPNKLEKNPFFSSGFSGTADDVEYGVADDVEYGVLDDVEYGVLDDVEYGVVDKGAGGG
jgi:hypothetical protein